MASFLTSHRAAWVLIGPDDLLQNAYVKTAAGRIVDVGQGRGYGDADRVVDYGPGVLMPALINAHTHLELSALKNTIDCSSGFIPWVQQVIEKRENAGNENLHQGISAGIDELIQSGSLVIGDISSMGISRKPFLHSQLSGILFKEYLGTDDHHAFEFETVKKNKKIAVAGHAPHTTATDLLIALKSAAKQHNMPFSLHLAESLAEDEFIRTGRGPWADFLNKRQLDLSAIKRFGAGPVAYANHLGLLDDNTLAVHLVFADQADIQLLAEHRVHVCLCLRSNQQLHQQLPDVMTMIHSGLNLCLGTDSLASNNSLSVFDEMRFLSESFPAVPPAEIIAMATINGAEALGYHDRLGRLEAGMRANMIYVPIRGNSAGEVRESIVSKAFNGEIIPIVEETLRETV